MAIVQYIKELIETLAVKLTDPEREYWTLSYAHFNKNRRFAMVESTIIHALSIFTRFDYNFFENA